MKWLLTLAGIVVVIMGVVFMGQGSGYFPYPATSVMINATQWIYYGAAIAAAGVALLVAARR